MKVREAKKTDIDEIEKIYVVAKAFMRSHDNPNQWKDGDYPGRALLLGDIDKHQLFVVTDDEDRQLLGVFAFIIGKDPTYDVIDGAWLNDKPYATYHRVASNGKAKGIGKCIVEWGKPQIKNLRADTHHDNYVMQNMLSSLGFTKCGIIYLANGDPRLAYHYEAE